MANTIKFEELSVLTEQQRSLLQEKDAEQTTFSWFRKKPTTSQDPSKEALKADLKARQAAFQSSMDKLASGTATLSDLLLLINYIACFTAEQLTILYQFIFGNEATLKLFTQLLSPDQSRLIEARIKPETQKTLANKSIKIRDEEVKPETVIDQIAKREHPEIAQTLSSFSSPEKLVNASPEALKSYLAQSPEQCEKLIFGDNPNPVQEKLANQGLTGLIQTIKKTHSAESLRTSCPSLSAAIKMEEAINQQDDSFENRWKHSHGFFACLATVLSFGRSVSKATIYFQTLKSELQPFLSAPSAGNEQPATPTMSLDLWAKLNVIAHDIDYIKNLKHLGTNLTQLTKLLAEEKSKREAAAIKAQSLFRVKTDKTKYPAQVAAERRRQDQEAAVEARRILREETTGQRTPQVETTTEQQKASERTFFRENAAMQHQEQEAATISTQALLCTKEQSQIKDILAATRKVQHAIRLTKTTRQIQAAKEMAATLQAETTMTVPALQVITQSNPELELHPIAPRWTMANPATSEAPSVNIGSQRKQLTVENAVIPTNARILPKLEEIPASAGKTSPQEKIPAFAEMRAVAGMPTQVYPNAARTTTTEQSTKFAKEAEASGALVTRQSNQSMTSGTATHRVIGTVQVSVANTTLPVSLIETRLGNKTFLTVKTTIAGLEHSLGTDQMPQQRSRHLFLDQSCKVTSSLVPTRTGITGIQSFQKSSFPMVSDEAVAAVQAWLQGLVEANGATEPPAIQQSSTVVVIPTHLRTPHLEDINRPEPRTMTSMTELNLRQQKTYEARQQQEAAQEQIRKEQEIKTIRDAEELQAAKLAEAARCQDEIEKAKAADAELKQQRQQAIDESRALLLSKKSKKQTQQAIKQTTEVAAQSQGLLRVQKPRQQFEASQKAAAEAQAMVRATQQQPLQAAKEVAASLLAEKEMIAPALLAIAKSNPELELHQIAPRWTTANHAQHIDSNLEIGSRRRIQPTVTVESAALPIPDAVILTPSIPGPDAVIPALGAVKRHTAQIPAPAERLPVANSFSQEALPSSTKVDLSAETGSGMIEEMPDQILSATETQLSPTIATAKPITLSDKTSALVTRSNNQTMTLDQTIHQVIGVVQVSLGNVSFPVRLIQNGTASLTLETAVYGSPQRLILQTDKLDYSDSASSNPTSALVIAQGNSAVSLTRPSSSIGLKEVLDTAQTWIQEIAKQLTKSPTPQQSSSTVETITDTIQRPIPSQIEEPETVKPLSQGAALNEDSPKMPEIDKMLLSSVPTPHLEGIERQELKTMTSMTELNLRRQKADKERQQQEAAEEQTRKAQEIKARRDSEKPQAANAAEGANRQAELEKPRKAAAREQAEKEQKEAWIPAFAGMTAVEERTTQPEITSRECGDRVETIKPQAKIPSSAEMTSLDEKIPAAAEEQGTETLSQGALPSTAPVGSSAETGMKKQKCLAPSVRRKATEPVQRASAEKVKQESPLKDIWEEEIVPITFGEDYLGLDQMPIHPSLVTELTGRIIPDSWEKLEIDTTENPLTPVPFSYSTLRTCLIHSQSAEQTTQEVRSLFQTHREQFKHGMPANYFNLLDLIENTALFINGYTHHEDRTSLKALFDNIKSAFMELRLQYLEVNEDNPLKPLTSEDFKADRQMLLSDCDQAFQNILGKQFIAPSQLMSISKLIAWIDVNIFKAKKDSYLGRSQPSTGSQVLRTPTKPSTGSKVLVTPPKPSKPSTGSRVILSPEPIQPSAGSTVIPSPKPIQPSTGSKVILSPEPIKPSTGSRVLDTPPKPLIQPSAGSTVIPSPKPIQPSTGSKVILSPEPIKPSAGSRVLDTPPKPLIQPSAGSTVIPSPEKLPTQPSIGSTVLRTPPKLATKPSVGSKPIPSPEPIQPSTSSRVIPSPARPRPGSHSQVLMTLKRATASDLTKKRSATTTTKPKPGIFQNPRKENTQRFHNKTSYTPS